MSVYRIRCEVCQYVNQCLASNRTDYEREEKLGCHSSIRDSHGGQLLAYEHVMSQ